ncbi:MAG: hypothetical protein V4562_02860 [Pseudomonadota bacterium]
MATTTPKAPAAKPAKPATKPAAAPAVVPAAPSVTASAKPAPAKKAVAKKPAAKPAAKKPAVKALPKAKVEKPAKPKKPKLVRDSFTIPKPEYLVLEELKQRAAKLQKATKKSEILRAGIKALAALSDAALLAALNNVPAIKTGRPSQS